MINLATGTFRQLLRLLLKLLGLLCNLGFLLSQIQLSLGSGRGGHLIRESRLFLSQLLRLQGQLGGLVRRLLHRLLLLLVIELLHLIL